MEYKISNRLKIASIILVVLGGLLWGYGYMKSHAVTEDNISEYLVNEHGDGHGNEHADAGHGDTHSQVAGYADADHAEDGHKMSHEEHALHQIHNRPYAALYVAAFFFFMIALGVLAFYAIQYAAQAGWSPVLFRVMEGITAYVLPGGILVLLVAAFAGKHLFIWMDADVVAHDKIIQAKEGWLNTPWFFIRGAIFLAGWSLYRYFSRKFSIAQDSAEDNSNFKKNFRISAGFLVFYIYTESMMSWDWIMSVDPHWFSTLFGWYVFASMFVSGITVIALITIYLKSKGLLEFVNDSHLHDLAKFMFGISIFWTYLWFSQFMLIWYSNIPEEVVYFVARIEDYKLPFFGMVAMNFLFPLLLLMNSDYKRIPWFVVMAGIVILCGHYLDVFNMIMPATVSERWFIGAPEIGAICFFAGLFLFIVFTALSKAPLLAKGNPFIKESEHFHY
ncbi:quinol:cytochrome c oxidoreductase quinone-binding subunit 2 [Winogradskyella wandonensis]|uniref:Quinol:cytochrome c oxidoreductase quinone-binding subunit 2 n=1 Tax=Winogradskyella wandonensis TaxID=1442586 RepID=A0A4R1KRB0_9FLAO|nr:quinol:cytochrome C oxidoreductase [Winogradskyella wandonensis]TCK67586.1 quinol:cytochrome c oxidoreductase quinone-binding subunit 2 [Winogradskyella wandonensis]